jgi:hypothetical protein
VGEFCHERADGNFDAEFFAQFADEALLGGFAGFAFAAGKFPQAAEVRVGVTLGDQKFAVVEEQGGADFN